jgi:ferric-dicitrate binding protein FerR (iron transport regulator)
VTIDDRVDRERARALMMAAMDGETSPAERRELDRLLENAPELQAEWRRLARVKEVTTGMTLQQLPEEAWDGYWTSVYRRTERGIAWILISAGAIVLGAYAMWHAIGAFLADREMPLFIRLAIVAIAVGSTILIVSVIREKVFAHRRDPYQKEIIR